MKRTLISFLCAAAVLGVAQVYGAVQTVRTLRVSFAQNQKMSDSHLKNDMADWTVKASEETGWCNIVPSRFPDASQKISATDVSVAPGVMNWTSGTLANWGVHINYELCGKGIMTRAVDFGDTTSLANHPDVAKVFPRGKDGFSPITKAEVPATLQGHAGYIIGAPVQFNLYGKAPGSVSVNGILPGETYTVTVLGGRPNSISENETVYSVLGGTVSDAQVVCTGTKAQTAAANPETQTVTVPMPPASESSDDYWAMMTFTVTAESDTLTVQGTTKGNIIALSVTGPALEIVPEPIDLMLTFKLKKNGETKGLSFDADSGMNVLTGSSEVQEAGGIFGEGVGQPIVFDGLKSADGSGWSGKVQLLPEGNEGKFGPKVGGTAAALAAAHFTDEQKRTVLEAFGIDEAFFSGRLVDGAAGVPFLNDYSYGSSDHTLHALGIAFTDLCPGAAYEVTALVGRSNAYTNLPKRGAYYVTGGTTMEAESVAYGGVTAPEAPTVADGRVTVTTASAWALMRFKVKATGPTLTLQAELNPGNIRALRVRSAVSTKTWIGQDAWAKPENWSPQGVPLASDTVLLAEHPWRGVTLNVPDGTELVRLVCSDSNTQYRLIGLPDAVPVHSDGVLFLTATKTPGVFGQKVSGLGAYVLGAAVTLNGEVSAPVEVRDGGALTVGPEAVLDRVTVYPGSQISGSGRVGTLVLHEGAVVRADSAGALRVGTLSVPAPVLYERTLPIESLPLISPVSVQVCLSGSAHPVLTADVYPQLDVEWQSSSGEPLSWMGGTLQRAAAVQPNQPTQLTFTNQPKGTTLGASVTAMLAVDGQFFFSVLPEDGVVREVNVYYVGTAGASDVFYCNPKAKHPKLADGASLAVNGQMFHPEGKSCQIWSARMPFVGLSAKTLQNGHGRVTAELFACNSGGDAQAIPPSLGYRIDLLAADGKTLLYSTDPTPAAAGEDDWVVGLVGEGQDGVMTASAVLVPTEAAAQAVDEAGFVLKYSMCNDSIGGTFGGLRSIRFDAAPDVPPVVEIPETLPNPDGTEVPVSDALHTAIQTFAEANGLTGRIELVPGTVCGEVLTAAQMNAAAEVFEGILRRVSEARTLAAAGEETVRLEVAYTFEVAGLVLTETGLDATARLLGADGQPTRLKPGAELRLLSAAQPEGPFVPTAAAFDPAALKLTLSPRPAEASFYRIEAVRPQP